MTEKFASVNVCAVGIDLVVYDPNIKTEEGEPSGLQRFLSLSWDQLIELVEGHESTRTIKPDLTDAALKMWGMSGPPTVHETVSGPTLDEAREMLGIDKHIEDDEDATTDAEYLRDLAERLRHIPVKYGTDDDFNRLRKIANELDGILKPGYHRVNGIVVKLEEPDGEPTR